MQKRHTIEGKVVIEGTSEPIPYVNVLLKELNLWAFTDTDGTFKITGIIPGKYTLEVSSLGYRKLTIDLDVNADLRALKFQLNEENLTLDQVVVTAVKGTSLNSSSRIEKTAIEHVQASSLADIMQLLPGNIIQNPTLTSQNRVTIRSIYDLNANNERGVGLLINGSRVSNDASLNLNPADPISGTTSTANTLDFRNYSTDNIESVEVLKGVLSAEYGDVTSGAIVVTTKAGYTPYEVRVKSDPRTKAIAFSKGFNLGQKRGSINIDADYAKAFTKWTSPVDIFDRTTMGITYSNTFNTDKSPLRFNVRLNGYISGNNVSSDPDVSKLDYYKRDDKRISLSLYGNWMLNKSWITTLNYNVSGSYEKDYANKYTVGSGSLIPSTNTLTEGIGYGYFIDPTVPRDYFSEEVPIYANAKISGKLNKKIGNTLSNTLFGLEYNTKGNIGRGEYYQSGAPQYFRERNYSEIPFMSDLSLFLEEKISLDLGKTKLELIGGARFNQMYIKGYNYSPTIDPRFNGKYDILPNRKNGVLKYLAIRGGWGIMQRLPSIVQLYPKPRYIDNPLFQYRNTTTGEELVIIQTSIIEDRLTYNLSPVRTRNIEFGIDFKLFGIDAQLTYFNEKLSDGITPNSTYLSETYQYYNSTTDPAAQPKYENGKVWVKDSQGNYVEQTYTTSREFKSFSKPDNRGIIDKWGIEYDLNFGKIKPLSTSLIINGSYIRSENSTPGVYYTYSGTADPLDSKQKFPYVGIFEGKDLMSIGDGRERLSTNFSLITHIPSIRMVISFVTQCIWLENTWNIYDSDKIYTLGANGEPVYGDYNNKLSTEVLYRDPISYMDHDGVIRPFNDYYTTSDPNLKMRLNMLRKATDQSYYFMKQGYNPYFMANIRITKEIGQTASLSFYANNFTNSTPILKNKARPNIVGIRKNTAIYFGAELKLTF